MKTVETLRGVLKKRATLLPAVHQSVLTRTLLSPGRAVHLQRGKKGEAEIACGVCVCVRRYPRIGRKRSSLSVQSTMKRKRAPSQNDEIDPHKQPQRSPKRHKHAPMPAGRSIVPSTNALSQANEAAAPARDRYRVINATLRALHMEWIMRRDVSRKLWGGTG